ncbi:MAG: sugar transferase [Sphingomonas sp.]
MLKRFIDVAIALVLAVPAFIIVAIACFFVRADSPGPALFWQERVGKDGKIFRLVKLRTMGVDTAQLASHQVSTATITKVGHTLRRYKIDELPQLYCVLAGTMSLVGPRPCLPNQPELIEARARRGVLRVRPGITGLAQVIGVDMSRPERLAYVDSLYVTHASLGLDLKLLLATVSGRGRGDAVAVSK